MAAQQNKSGKSGGKGNSQSDNGQGKTKPIEDSDTQDARRRAKKAAQKVVARGMHKETMTSGLVADELARRKAIADAAVIQLQADAITLEKSLTKAAPSRIKDIRSQRNAVLSAIPVVEAFGADPLMKFRDRSYAIRQVRHDNARVGIAARNALSDADKDFVVAL